MARVFLENILVFSYRYNILPAHITLAQSENIYCLRIDERSCLILKAWIKAQHKFEIDLFHFSGNGKFQT